MITRYMFENDVPVPLDEQANPMGGKSLIWVDLEAPTPEECRAVCEEFNIPRTYMEAALDIRERPRIEGEDGISLVLARTPIRSGLEKDVAFNTCPVAVIPAAEAVVTVCLKEGVVKKLLLKRLKGAGKHRAMRLVLSLQFRISTTFIEYLEEMDEIVEGIEQTLHESMQNKELLRIMHLEKSLIYFLPALKGNQSVVEKLRSMPAAQSPDCAALIDDVLVENKQATDTADIFSQVMGSISDAFGAVVSNNLNKVMKVLTGLTIVFMVPSIIGALYGMNVALPWQESPFAFAALCALCLGISLFVTYALRKLNWM